LKADEELIAHIYSGSLLPGTAYGCLKSPKHASFRCLKVPKHESSVQ